MVRQSFVGILASWFVAIAISLPAYAADQNPQSTDSVEASPQNSSQSPVPTAPSQATPSASGLPAMPPPKVLEDYWIDPDRPHIADSSINVPKGLWLQENGFQQSYPNRSSQTFDFPESLFRLGISNRTELRYNVPNFVTLSAIQLSPENVAFRQHFTGFESMQAGFKTRLGPIGPTKFQLAVNPFVSIPSGFGGPNSRRVDYFIKFPFSQELNERWDIEGMQSFFLPTAVNGKRNFDWQNSIVLNRSWGRQKNVFIEYVSDIFEYGHMSNLIHFGAAYRPGRRQQMDVQFGFRMNQAAPIAFFGFGYSFLLGSLNTPRLSPSRFSR
jgi:hypothetical protein